MRDHPKPLIVEGSPLAELLRARLEIDSLECSPGQPELATELLIGDLAASVTEALGAEPEVVQPSEPADGSSSRL